MSVSSPPVRLYAVPRRGPAPVDTGRPAAPAPTVRAGVGGPGLDLLDLLHEAVECRPRGAPEVEVLASAVSLRMHGRAAEAWLASWLQAWFRWVDGVACGPVQARLSATGHPSRARLRLQFHAGQARDPHSGAPCPPLETAPCWRTFMPLGAALHEVPGPAPGQAHGPGGHGRPARLHRVHIDLGPCLDASDT